MCAIHWLNKWNKYYSNAKYIDVVMPIYNLIEFCDNYLKTWGSFWQYYRDDPNDNITQSDHSITRLKQQKNLLLLVNKRMLK